MKSTKNKKGINNNNKNNNKKRAKEREKGTAQRERGGGEARSYMQKKTNESKPEDLSTTNA